MKSEPVLIGVIGGIGPYAGLDFMRNIFANTIALRDQEHLDCVLVTCPSIIPNRTDYILSGGKTENPALGLFESAKKLHAAGVRYAVAACNTAHAPVIFKPFCEMARTLSGLTIINMLETCASFVKENMSVRRIGLLASRGTYESRVYNEYFTDGFEIIEPDLPGQEKVYEAISSKEFGIKAFSHPIKPAAIENIKHEINALIDRGAQAIILGCTELPLAIQACDVPVPIIDPGLIAARALITLAAPEKLLPLTRKDG